MNKDSMNKPRPRLVKAAPGTARNQNQPTNKPTEPPVEVAPARRAAFEVLMRVTGEDAYASNLLASDQYDSLSREDHGLLNELVLGVLRWQRTLDLLIERYAKRPVNQLDREVVLSLRLALYQLRFLSRIPAHAALNEAVNLVKLHDKVYAAPFVNGVLRSAVRDIETPLATMFEEIPNEIARFGFSTSHPSWLLKRWQARLGEEATLALTKINNTPPRLAFRFNELQAPEAETRAWLAAQNIEIRASTIAPNAAVIESGSLSGQSEALQNGWLYLQDEASQLVAHMAAYSADEGKKERQKDGELLASNESAIRNPQSAITRVLDMCAAPGSKALLLASLLPEVDVIANDLHAHRLRTLEELRERTGVLNILFQQFDAVLEMPDKWRGRFDVVLLDAPCSGLGTLQRHPEIKWRVTETKLKELAELQTALLKNALLCLKPGGVVVYSVCSTEPEEGENVIATLRTEDQPYQDLTGETLTALGLNAEDFLTDSFGARTWPHKHGCEGFFFCVLSQQPTTNN